MLCDDERGQAIQIGAVILFSFAVIGFSLYQATVVPDQNGEVEFNHNRDVQQDMLELQNAIYATAASGDGASASVQLGTTYPARVFAVNPGSPGGSLRTFDPGDASELTIENAAATAGGPTNFWDGTSKRYPTTGIRYEPNYNVYSQAPATVYENSVVYNLAPDGGVAVQTDQRLVDGREVDLLSLLGSYQQSSSGTASVDVRGPTNEPRTVTVQPSGGNITITVPTDLSESTWETLLESELVSNGGYVVASSITVSSGLLSFELAATDGAGNPVSYELRTPVAGVGANVPQPTATYVTKIDGDGTEVAPDGAATLTVEIRDLYNAPVSGVTPSASASAGTASVPGPSDENGQTTVEYTAPSTAGTQTVSVEDDLDDSGTVDPDETVTFTVEVVASSGGGGDTLDPVFSSGPAANPTTIGQGQPIDLNATIDDMNGNGGTDIVSATWSDAVSGDSGTFSPDDGEFDQPKEAVSAKISGSNTSGWSTGDHEITVTGSDANGNTVSETVTVTVTPDPGPPGGKAFADANDNGVYDSGETTYTVSKLRDFDEKVNLVIPSDVGGGTLSNPGGDIKIKAVKITSDVNIDAGSITLKAEKGSEGPIDISATSLTSSGDVEVVATDIDASDGTIETTGGSVTLKAEKGGGGPIDIDGSDISTAGGNDVKIKAKSVSGRNAEITATQGSITVEATVNVGGEVDVSGGRLKTTGGNKISLKSKGDVFLDDTATQQAKVEAADGGAVTVNVEKKSNTLHVDGLEIIDDDDTLKLEPDKANVDGTPESGSVG